MRGVFICAGELDALHGTGPLAFSAYIWLRAWADLRTGVVGVSRPISLSMLRSYCETHTPKGAGHQVTKPTERGIRTALAALERAGLLMRLPDDRRLVFRLSMMALPQSVQIEPDANLTGEPDTVPGMGAGGRKGGNGAGFRLVRNLNPTLNPTGVDQPNATHIRDQSFTLRSPTTTHPTLGDAAGAAVGKGGLAEGSVQALATALRGAGVQVRDGDPQLAELVQQGVQLSDLLAAVERCRAARAKARSDQPLNLGFVVSLLNSQQTDRAWRTDDDEALARGREAGIEPRPGESWSEFRQRLSRVLARSA